MYPPFQDVANWVKACFELVLWHCFEVQLQAVNVSNGLPDSNAGVNELF